MVGDLDAKLEPQDFEESKEALKMSERVYVEARGLEADQAATRK